MIKLSLHSIPITLQFLAKQPMNKLEGIISLSLCDMRFKLINLLGKILNISIIVIEFIIKCTDHVLLLL